MIKKYALFLGLVFSFSSYATATAPTDCDCPTLACDPCSYQKSITFYSSKCGANDSKVKSCARPTCIPLDEATPQCPVLPTASTVREPVVVGKPVGSDSSFVAAPVEVGKVKVLKGSVSIVQMDGKATTHGTDVALKEGERVDTTADSDAVIEFKGGNKVHVHSDSGLEVKQYSGSDSTKKVMLNLIRGKIRNQVKEKYNGQTSYYKITSKSAVAGVRGTDFVFEQRGEVAIVETLSGAVTFGSAKGGDSAVVAKGMGAIVEQGLLKPVYRMSADRLERLERESDLENGKRMAKIKDEKVCKNPVGAFDKCVWKCVNNPEGEKRCRTDLPKVSCQRSRCNANGEWAEGTLLPANHGDLCSGEGARVKDCDY